MDRLYVLPEKYVRDDHTSLTNLWVQLALTSELSQKQNTKANSGNAKSHKK